MKNLLATLAAISIAGGAYAGVPATITTEYVGSFSNPVGIYHAGDSRLFIVQQSGLIRISNDGTTLTTPFLDLSALTTFGGERGLLGLAFHPDYETNGYFYVNYINTSSDTVIARYQVSGNPNLADPTSGKIMLTIDQDFTNHNGGQLQFGPDGYLYIGMGDGGSGGDPNCRAQSDNTLLGKMLRIDVDQNVNTSPYYGIPADNPHVGAGDPADEVWAKGLRNPWRFSFDRQTGDLWIADVGQSDLEEINYVPSGTSGGLNFGWRIMEGTNCFSSSTTNCIDTLIPCNDPSLTMPVFVYNRDGGRCAVTGGFVYNGPSAPYLQGKYIYADYCSGDVYALDPNNGFTSEVLFDALSFVSSFGEGVNGDLYMTAGNDIVRIIQEGTSVGTTWTVY